MADQSWFVAVDGNQLGGGHGDAEVRDLMKTHAGRQLLVWREPMVEWVDPKTIPALAAAPVIETAAAAAPAPPPAAAPAPAPAAPAPAPRPSPRPSVEMPDVKGTFQQESKFFAGLLDLKFQTFVTPKVIGTLYAVALVLIALGAVGLILSGLGAMVTSLRFGGGFAGVLMAAGMIVVAPLFAIFQAAILRVFFELALVLFRIKENTDTLAGRKGE